VVHRRLLLERPAACAATAPAVESWPCRQSKSTAERRRRSSASSRRQTVRAGRLGGLEVSCQNQRLPVATTGKTCGRFSGRLPRGHLRSARAPRLRAAGLCTAGNHGENNVPHASPSAGQENRFDVLILYGAITADTDLQPPVGFLVFKLQQ